MSQIAVHDGVVTSIQDGLVKVEMHVVSACSSCKAHEKCSFVDKAEKTVEVETAEWRQYSVGERVLVSVNESLGLLAVLLAYLMPAVLLVASVVLVSLATGSEGIAALVTLAVVALYFVLLWHFHDRLQHKFSFGIQKVVD